MQNDSFKFDNEPAPATVRWCAGRVLETTVAAEGWGLLGNVSWRGTTVLLLADLLAARSRYYRDTLVAVARHAQAVGARVVIGGSPWLKGEGVAVHYQATGLATIARKAGWVLADFERLPITRVCAGRRVYHLPKTLFETDVVVNFSSAYRHRRLRLAGAMFGLLNALPGTKQTALLRLKNAGASLADVIVDLTALIAPALHSVAILRAGSGTSLWSDDPVSLDVVTARLAGLAPERLDWLKLAAESGLGLLPLDVLDPAVDQAHLCLAQLAAFRADRLTRWPAVLEAVAGRRVLPRPEVRPERCLRCDMCRETCPTGNAAPAGGRKLLASHTICWQCGRCLNVCPSHAVMARPAKLWF